MRDFMESWIDDAEEIQRLQGQPVASFKKRDSNAVVKFITVAAAILFYSLLVCAVVLYKVRFLLIAVGIVLLVASCSATVSTYQQHPPRYLHGNCKVCGGVTCNGVHPAKHHRR